jgi:ABC-type bacteriocin/lantibiotic exporter with double-glycine peptidase domain
MRLFSATILENIRCGQRGATLAEVRDASRIACAEEFICDLPDGYDTQLGENALDLSAGQRQRVFIARLVLRRPLVLILDEATSFLDRDLEAQVLSNLRKALGKRTIVYVSHRPSILSFADHVWHVEDGNVHKVSGEVFDHSSVVPPILCETEPCVSDERFAAEGSA